MWVSVRVGVFLLLFFSIPTDNTVDFMAPTQSSLSRKPFPGLHPIWLQLSSLPAAPAVTQLDQISEQNSWHQQWKIFRSRKQMVVPPGGKTRCSKTSESRESTWVLTISGGVVALALKGSSYCHEEGQQKMSIWRGQVCVRGLNSAARKDLWRWMECLVWLVVPPARKSAVC